MVIRMFSSRSQTLAGARRIFALSVKPNTAWCKISQLFGLSSQLLVLDELSKLMVETMSFLRFKVIWNYLSLFA